MKIPEELHIKHRSTMAALREHRQHFKAFWRDISDFYLPKRYMSLLSGQERSRIPSRNPMILDGTGTISARTLASGMMNGITSPSRPWFRLRIAGFEDDIDHESRVWLDEVTRRMLFIMAESNFYNALAVMYLDLVVFGTAAMIIYEDVKEVIRCYNPALGEYYVGQDDRLQVNIFAREFSLRAHQAESKFGKENLSPLLQESLNQGGAQRHNAVSITHLIEPPNKFYNLPKRFKWVETYWETSGPQGMVLKQKGFNEFPCIVPRWELTANDSYGTSPAMDAYGDVVQLQHETKKKAQGLDKMISPPIIADVQLQHKPMALLPNGVTYVTGINNVGAKPVYQVQIPIGEMTIDIREIQARIRETFHNDLFRMISQLDTVRSATEIDARREEKLVLLGPVLERFENEGLDPAINRLFAIMSRKKLLPDPPQSIVDADIEIQYVSILAAAQRAVGTVATERWLALIGETAAMHPKAVNVPQWDQLIRDYGKDVGVAARHIKPQEQLDADNAAMDQQAAVQQAAEIGPALVEGARTLSETDVGGGQNALQQVIGG